VTVCTRAPMRVSISALPDPSARPPARPPQGVRGEGRVVCEQGRGGVANATLWGCSSTGKDMHWSLPEVAGVAQTKAREWGEGLPQAASAVAHAGRTPLHTTKARPHGAVCRLDN